MTFNFWLFLAVGLSLLLAGPSLRRRVEITALARVKCPARNPASTLKDQL